MPAYSGGRLRPVPVPCVGGHSGAPSPCKERDMGKYFLGWLLGIPAIVLVILYFVFGG